MTDGAHHGRMLGDLTELADTACSPAPAQQHGVSLRNHTFDWCSIFLLMSFLGWGFVMLLRATPAANQSN